MTRDRLVAVCVVMLVCASGFVKAEDWPQIQGKDRRNVWTETGILDAFPPQGLTVRWRTPIHAGYCGPAVADGRVFVADYNAPKDGKAVERALCLDEQTGAILWTYENPDVHYGSVGYPYGPRATPTVDGDRVFVLGTAGDLYCLNVKTGHLNWAVNYQKDFHAKQPTWGFASAPLVYGQLVICLANGDADGLVVALDRNTGKEVWRSMPPEPDPGYSAPILIHQGGVDQLIQWHSAAVSSLNPKTGLVYWDYRDPSKMTIATPLWQGDRLFVTAFFTGPIMLQLDTDKPAASLLWRGKSSSEVKTDGLHSTISTPILKDGYIYGVCSYGQFRCLDATTGQRVWETMDVTKENARWASAFITPNGGRYFINNDRGELIIAELSPAGYHEISRTELIKPTTPPGVKRERTGVNWVLPAYANRHILIRNDEEIIRVSLEQPAAGAASKPASATEPK